jgi:hypothetical protein
MRRKNRITWFAVYSLRKFIQNLEEYMSKVKASYFFEADGHIFI